MTPSIITARPVQATLDFLFPPICLACRREERPGPLTLGLCLPCRGRLKPLHGARCSGCGSAAPGAAVPGGSRCGACRGRRPSYQRLLALWSFEPPLDQVIHGLKFGRLDFLGSHLAAEIWHRLGGTLRGVDVVVPVPLHWRRQMGRGYNQAERIARPLARRLRRPLVVALRRRRATRPQARLERSRRRANLSRAFRGRRAERVRGRRILLVDDVTTTGETLRQAARELRRIGATAVLALAAARTPSAGDSPCRSAPLASSAPPGRRPRDTL